MSPVEIITLTVSILAVVAAAAAAIYVGRALEKADVANRTAEASLRFQVLVPALTEYRSPDMYVAISRLWEFYKKCAHSSLAEALLRDRELDSRRINGLRSEEEISRYMRTTIDFYRRQVGQFYGLLTSIHDEGGYQRKWLYTYWRRRELRIIPEILIPLERALAEDINAPPPTVSIDRLNRLYEDCPD